MNDEIAKQGSKPRRIVLPLGRPHLWRFWEVDKEVRSREFPDGRERLFKLRLSGRGIDDPDRPWRVRLPALAVTAVQRSGPIRFFRFGVGWYPGGGFRRAPVPLFSVHPEIRLRSLCLFLEARAQQGWVYSLAIGFAFMRKGELR